MHRTLDLLLPPAGAIGDSQVVQDVGEVEIRHAAQEWNAIPRMNPTNSPSQNSVHVIRVRRGWVGQFQSYFIGLHLPRKASAVAARVVGKVGEGADEFAVRVDLEAFSAGRNIGAHLSHSTCSTTVRTSVKLIARGSARGDSLRSESKSVHPRRWKSTSE